MKVLVTGGNGFTGSHLVDRLVQEHLDVRCIVRRKSSQKWLMSQPIEIVECDEVNAQVLQKAVVDVEMIFHVLGTVKAPNLAKFRQVNVTPGQQLLEACRSTKDLKRFLLVGSQGAAGPNRHPDDKLVETDPCQPVSAYGRSKLEAEEVTRAYHGSIPYTIVRPSAFYGPRDTNFYKFFKLAEKGLFLEVGKARKAISFAHVRDIVDGIWRAAVSEQSVGETYFLSSDLSYSFDDVRVVLEKTVGKKLKHITIPDSVVKIMMGYADFSSKFLQKDLLLNRDRLATLRFPRWVCDISKAKTELGYTPSIPLDEGFQETYQWYINEGWL